MELSLPLKMELMEHSLLKMELMEPFLLLRTEPMEHYHLLKMEHFLL
jgi:hypothetical protein